MASLAPRPAFLVYQIHAIEACSLVPGFTVRRANFARELLCLYFKMMRLRWPNIQVQ
jgi:hypothetical protein